MPRYPFSLLLIAACVMMLFAASGVSAAHTGAHQPGHAAMASPCGAMDMDTGSHDPTGLPVKMHCAVGCMMLTMPTKMPNQGLKPTAIAPYTRLSRRLGSVTRPPDTPPPQPHSPSFTNQSIERRMT